MTTITTETTCGRMLADTPPAVHVEVVDMVLIPQEDGDGFESIEYLVDVEYDCC